MTPSRQAPPESPPSPTNPDDTLPAPPIAALETWLSRAGIQPALARRAARKLSTIVTTPEGHSVPQWNANDTRRLLGVARALSEVIAPGNTARLQFGHSSAAYTIPGHVYIGARALQYETPAAVLASLAALVVHEYGHQAHTTDAIAEARVHMSTVACDTVADYITADHIRTLAHHVVNATEDIRVDSHTSADWPGLAPLTDWLNRVTARWSPTARLTALTPPLDANDIRQLHVLAMLRPYIPRPSQWASPLVQAYHDLVAQWCSESVGIDSEAMACSIRAITRPWIAALMPLLISPPAPPTPPTSTEHDRGSDPTPSDASGEGTPSDHAQPHTADATADDATDTDQSPRPDIHGRPSPLTRDNITDDPYTSADRWISRQLGQEHPSVRVRMVRDSWSSVVTADARRIAAQLDTALLWRRTRRPVTQHHRTSGRLDAPHLWRLPALGDDDIAMRRSEYRAPSVDITLLIDGSGSMGARRDCKMTAASTAAYAIILAARRQRGIAVHTYVHTTGCVTNDIVLRSLASPATPLPDVYAALDMLQGWAGNADAYALLYVAHAALQRRADIRIIMLISDGMPCQAVPRVDANDELARAATVIQSLGVLFVPIYIAPVVYPLPGAIYAWRDLDQFPTLLARTIARQLDSHR